MLNRWLNHASSPWSIYGGQVLDGLQVDIGWGLSEAEAAARLRAYGPNHLQTRIGRKWLGVLIG